MRWLLLGFALLLSGCNTEMQWERERVQAVHAIVPTSYRADIVAFMRSYLNDPSGVRNASVSAPVQKSIEGLDRYMSCVRYTAKKGGGQYAASKDSLVLYRNGRLDRLIDNARETCKDAAYLPFPELERMTR